jgi:Spy/CpxP family protein refolding chaperone
VADHNSDLSLFSKKSINFIKPLGVFIMNKRTIIIASIVIALSAVGLTKVVLAFPPNMDISHGSFSEHSGKINAMPFGNQMVKIFQMMESLELSQAQRKEIWSILDKKRPQMRTHMIALFEGRKQLRKLTTNELDENKLNKLAKIQGQIITKLIVLRAQTRSQIRSILTPEQRSKLLEKISNLHKNKLSQIDPETTRLVL